MKGFKLTKNAKDHQKIAHAVKSVNDSGCKTKLEYETKAISITVLEQELQRAIENLKDTCSLINTIPSCVSNNKLEHNAYIACRKLIHKLEDDITILELQRQVIALKIELYYR